MKRKFVAWLFGAALLPIALVLPQAHSQPATGADNVMEMEDATRPPAGAVGPQPIGPRDISMANYPRKSFIAGEEGRTRLRVLVGADGTVEDAKVEGSSGSQRLDQAAVELVRGWRYQPAIRDGIAVAARFPVNIEWKLLLSSVQR